MRTNLLRSTFLAVIFVSPAAHTLEDLPIQTFAKDEVFDLVTTNYKPCLLDELFPELTGTCEEEDRDFSTALAPGEFESFPIGIHALEDIDYLQAAVTKELEHTISQETISVDLRIVKVWPQAGIDRAADPSSPVDVPELLLYDDTTRQPLIGVHDTCKDYYENLLVLEGQGISGMWLDERAHLQLPTDQLTPGWPQEGTIRFDFLPDGPTLTRPTGRTRHRRRQDSWTGLIEDTPSSN